MLTECNRTGSDRWPAPIFERNQGSAVLPGNKRTRLAPGVRQLDAWHRPLSANERRGAGKRSNVVVLPDTQVAGRDPAMLFDRGGFGHDERGPTYSAAAQVDQVPIRGKTILAGVLAHRRNRD